MSCPRLDTGAPELYFYGEMAPEVRTAFDAHLRRCHPCAAALRDLEAIGAALDARPDVASPPAGDWSAFMARLERRLEQDTLNDTAPPGSGRGSVVPWLAAAAALLLTTATAVLTLRSGATVPTPEPAATPASVRPVARTQEAPDAALVRVSGQHFERSKLVVLGLTTKEPKADDWSYERELAGTLLDDTRLYRAAAEERGMQSLASVMRDLELVLLQTAMSAEPDAQALEQLQRLIRRRDLVAKMHVEPAEAAPAADPASGS